MKNISINYWGYFTPFGGYGIANLNWISHLSRQGVDVFPHKKFSYEPGSPEHKIFTEEHKQNLKLAAQKRSKELSQKHKGDNNPSAKLDWDKVNYIRTSDKSVKDLATELSVSITTIYKIKNNQIWLA